LLLSKSGFVKLSDSLAGVHSILEDADDCGTLLSIHGRLMQQM
jgi:hypothetical protein